MNEFLQDLLKMPPCSSQYKTEVSKLIEEFIRIGKTDDYLSERPTSPFNLQCRHSRARQIGQRLHDIGDLPLMNYAYRQTRRKVGKLLAAHLEYCWAEIGRWLP